MGNSTFLGSLFAGIRQSLLHVAFPHVCDSCGTDILDLHHRLCLRCLSAMPATGFHMHSNNPVEKIFWGRLPIAHATAQYYFTKESLMQKLMHQVKYRGNRELGIYLGRLMGNSLAECNRFGSIDALVPLPLHPTRQKKRGYNQAALLCQGISEVLNKPVWHHALARTGSTESQTRKTRVERWQNMQGMFALSDEHQVQDKHVLLVDDVITTGATLEACGSVLLAAPGTKLSIATLCFSLT